MNAAVIDIGSNSVRLLIVDGAGREMVRDVAITGLGSGVDETGRIGPTGYEATMRVIERYAANVREHDAATLEAVATSASRDAANGSALMDDIERVLGTRPRVIGGDVEAVLAFGGATARLPPRDRKLVIDIGGGSTEFVFGALEPTYVTSIDMGSVRLTDRRVLRRPVPPDMIEAVRAECVRAFAPVELPAKPDRAIGVAGTFTSLAAIAMDLDRYDRDVVHGSALRIDDVHRLVESLARLTVTETERIPSLDPARAPVVFAGAVVAEQAMAHCGLDAVTISEYDLLDGLAASALARR